MKDPNTYTVRIEKKKKKKVPSISSSGEETVDFSSMRKSRVCVFPGRGKKNRGGEGELRENWVSAAQDGGEPTCLRSWKKEEGVRSTSPREKKKRVPRSRPKKRVTEKDKRKDLVYDLRGKKKRVREKRQQRLYLKYGGGKERTKRSGILRGSRR